MPFDAFKDFTAHRHPFDLLPPALLNEAAQLITRHDIPAGESIIDVGDRLKGLYVIRSGAVDLVTSEGDHLSHLGKGDAFGQRALLRDGLSPIRATAHTDCNLFLIPKAAFTRLIEASPGFKEFYDRTLARSKPASAAGDLTTELTSSRIGDLMTRNPITLSPEHTARDAAEIMRDKKISCVLITDDAEKLIGIITSGDLAHRVVAAGLPSDVALGTIMTASPSTLSPQALGFDALLNMTENHYSHLPVVDKGELVGIITNTNLVRQQAVSAPFLVSDIRRKSSFEDLAAIIAKTPHMLAQLVGSGVDAHNIGRIITSVTDTLTRRLLDLGQDKLGAAPVPYLWLACGSQGRMEQTGISDQDNCLILDDSYDPSEHGTYFKELAQYVSDGLDACGYFYCPGDMMATNPQWCQPASVWRGYFDGWIDRPDPKAQMLASVMFDLRAIAGEASLFGDMHEETLERAKKNSIFRAHMISNSLNHTPPLSLFRGFALIKSGEHKDTVDLKHNGVVPIVDLGRVYALEAASTAINTQDRLLAAKESGVLSSSGASDLIDAYDFIASMRLEHQARQIREGHKPDNFMAPAILSELERNHLKDAFTVIKTLQSALAHSHRVG